MKKILICIIALTSLHSCGNAQKNTESNNYETDVFTTKSGKKLSFQALMHACIRLTYDGKEIQIDPGAANNYFGDVSPKSAND